MNSTETAEILRDLQSTYPDYMLSDDMAMLWASTFANENASAVKHAVRVWTADRANSWPTPANIRATARAGSQQQARDLSYTSRRDEREAIVSPTRGREVASNAYEADCAARGVEPDWPTFNVRMGITKTEPTRERKRGRAR